MLHLPDEMATVCIDILDYEEVWERKLYTSALVDFKLVIWGCVRPVRLQRQTRSGLRERDALARLDIYHSVRYGAKDRPIGTGDLDYVIEDGELQRALVLQLTKTTRTSWRQTRTSHTVFILMSESGGDGPWKKYSFRSVVAQFMKIFSRWERRRLLHWLS